jgi:hypothetical protein
MACPAETTFTILDVHTRLGNSLSPLNGFTDSHRTFRKPTEMGDQVQVDVVPPAEERVVEPEDFTPTDYLVLVLRRDGGSCICGSWHFVSAICGHVYRVHDQKCGAKSAGRGNRSAYCPQTSGRILHSNVKVNAPCPAAVCQPQD